jgi:hypothetical protein
VETAEFVTRAAKDALARNYVSLATNTRAPSLDLQALFAGTERRTGMNDG